MTKVDLGSVSYILGVFSIILAFISPFGGLVSGIVGLVYSKKQKVEEAKRLNIIGIVLSSILLAILIIAFVYSLVTGVESSNLFPLR